MRPNFVTFGCLGSLDWIHCPVLHIRYFFKLFHILNPLGAQVRATGVKHQVSQGKF